MAGLEVEVHRRGAADLGEERHGEIARRRTAHRIRAPPRSHSRIIRMHALDLIPVLQLHRAPVKLPDPPHDRRVRLLGRDVLRRAAPRFDLNGVLGDLVLALVELHGVGAGLHQRRLESTAAAAGFSPVLRFVVVPVDDGLEPGRDPGRGAGDGAALTRGHVSLDAEAVEEARVYVC